jgi:hypothetical protein
LFVGGYVVFPEQVQRIFPPSVNELVTQQLERLGIASRVTGTPVVQEPETVAVAETPTVILPLPTSPLATPTTEPTATEAPTLAPAPTDTAAPEATPVPPIVEPTNTSPPPTDTATAIPTPTPPPTNTPPPPTVTSPPPNPDDEPPPTATPGFKYAAPRLISPAPDFVFIAGNTIDLQWESVGELAPDEYYAVRLVYFHNTVPTYKGENVQATQWTVPLELYHEADGPEFQHFWYVSVEKGLADGSAIPISPESEQRFFTWD